MSKARGLADLGNAYSDGALSNRNMIINGSFRVSQRGNYTSVSTMTHNIYFLDRWRNYAISASTIQDLGGYVEIKATAAAGSSAIRLFQFIEDLYLLEGQTVTVSCEMKSNSSNGRLQMHNGSWVATSAVHTGGGEWENLSFTTTMPSSLTVTSVQVGIDGASSANVPIAVGDYCQIKNVQLEVGDTATPFEHRSYGDELAKCQRYYYSAADGVQQTLGIGVNYSASVMFGAITFPVTMRAKPTLNAASGTNYYEFIRNGAADFFNSLSLGNRTTAKIGEIENTSQISGTVGHGGYIRTDNSAVYVHFDAEL